MTAYTVQSRNQPKIRLEVWPTLLFFAGLMVLFLGERVVSDRLRWPVDIVGFLGLLGSLGALGIRYSRARDPDDRQAHFYLLNAGLVAVLGVGVYFVFKEAAEPLRGMLGKSFERIDAMATLAWPALVILGTLPMAFIQLSLRSMTDGDGYAEHVELVRVRYSAQSGVTVALVVIFCGAVNYVASERNSKVDLARFRSTRPSEATRKIVQNLSRPVRATLFFPNPNEIRELVVPFFADLAKMSSQFTYEVVDHAIEPNKARDLAATGNGLIVLSQLDDKGHSAQRETLNIGTTLELAQSALSTFDGDVQKRLLTLTRPGRIAYFTVGHGERGFDTGGFFDLQKDDLRAPVGMLRTLLQNQAYEVRTLGVGQGLGHQVPGDAGLVIVAGPTEHFLPEEVTTLSNYLNQGGHLFLLLDPTGQVANADLASLLKQAGLRFNSQVLCNDVQFAQRTRKASDKANIVSISFSSHVSVTTLSRASGRAAVILPKSGWFERDGAAPPGVQVDFPVRSMPETYADANNNFTRDPAEKQQAFDAAAVAQKSIGETKDGKSKKEMRLFALGSVDALSDLALLALANRYLASDPIKWLVNDEAIVGETAQESDLPIVHTKDQDKLWFYSTIFAAPVLLLAVGLLYIGRVRRRRAS